MLDRLPFKKDYLLIALAILLLLVCYQFAFKNTINEWQIYTELQQKATHTNALSIQPTYLKRKNENLDKILTLYKADTIEFRSNSVNKIAIIADKNNVKLSEIPLSDPAYHSDKFIIQKITIEGNYFSLTKTLQSIQSTNGIGMIRSVAYKVTSGKGNTDDKRLAAQVYLEIAK